MTKCLWNGDQMVGNQKVVKRCSAEALYEMPFYKKPYCQEHFRSWVVKKQKSMSLKKDETTGLTVVILLQNKDKVWVIYDGRAHDEDLVDDASVYEALCSENGDTRESAMERRDIEWQDGALYEYDSVPELLPGEPEGGKTHNVLRNQTYIP